jgi:hypothetical protein
MYTNAAMYTTYIHVYIYVCTHTNRHISYTVRCCRTLVLDSRTRDEATTRLGGKLGETIVLPANVVVWGDVRLDVYFHLSSRDVQNRKLAFFCVFNTAFYYDREHMAFRKRFVDMLHKDHSNTMVADNFCMTFVFNRSIEAAEELAAAANFR